MARTPIAPDLNRRILRMEEEIRQLRLRKDRLGFHQLHVARVTTVVRATEVTSSGIYVPLVSGLVFKSGTSPGDAAWEMVNVNSIGYSSPPFSESVYDFRLDGCYGTYNGVSPGAMTVTWGFGSMSLAAGGVVDVLTSNPIASVSQAFGASAPSPGPNSTATSYSRRPYFGDVLREYAPFISFPAAMAAGSKFWLHMDLWAQGPVDPQRRA